MTNHLQKGYGYIHVTHFACATVNLEKFCHGTLLAETNNAVDGIPIFLALWTTNAIQAPSVRFITVFVAKFVV